MKSRSVILSSAACLSFLISLGNLDWIAPAQNENGTNRDWVVNSLRPTLNAKGYNSVKLQVPDDDGEFWQIFGALSRDPAYNQIVDAVGYHIAKIMNATKLDRHPCITRIRKGPSKFTICPDTAFV